MTQQAFSAQSDPITVTPIPAFNDNYIWLINRKQSDQFWLVDPGDGQAVLNHFKSLNISSLSGILITHHHPDHIGGISQLIQNFPNIAVYGVASERVPAITNPIEVGSELPLAPDLSLQVIDVPGHTRDHIAYYRADSLNPILFSGDTLFAGGCGRLFEGTPAQMRRSLSKLRQLPQNTQVFCAHEYTLSNLKFALAVEPNNQSIADRIAKVESLRISERPSIPSSIQEEIATNPFLRWDQPDVIEMAVSRGAESNDSDDVFAKIRAWKDNF